MKMTGLEHPKTLDLSARLDISLPQTIGHLELMWAFTAQQAPHGNIGKWPDGAIARAAHWNGDPELFVTALRVSGFLDKCHTHRYVVHDWPEHCPRWVVSKLSRAGEDFCTPDYTPEYTGDSSEDNSAYPCGREPSQAMPSQAKPPPRERAREAPRDEAEQKSRFAEFWQAYPNKTGKKPSREKWKRKRLDRIADEIIADVQARKERDRKWLDGYVPNPLTYINQERWLDEIQEPREDRPKSAVARNRQGIERYLAQQGGAHHGKG